MVEKVNRCIIKLDFSVGKQGLLSDFNRATKSRPKLSRTFWTNFGHNDTQQLWP